MIMKRDSTNNEIGDILCDLRKSTGMTQEEFSKIFHVCGGSIAHYERGIRIPNPDMLKMYADYFHVSVDYLLGRSTLKIDTSEFNNIFYKNTTISEVVELILSLPKEKRRYLLETLKLLKS